MNKENLYKAIELAQGAGVCKYRYEDKPRCVIAQLIVLEGGDIEKIPSKYNGSCISFLIENDQYTAGLLAKYPLDLLSDLQRIWDDCNEPYEGRLLMKEVVDNVK